MWPENLLTNIATVGYQPLHIDLCGIAQSTMSTWEGTERPLKPKAVHVLIHPGLTMINNSVTHYGMTDVHMKQAFFLQSEHLIPDIIWVTAETEFHMRKSESFKLMPLACKTSSLSYTFEVFSCWGLCPLGLCGTFQTHIHTLTL